MPAAKNALRFAPETIRVPCPQCGTGLVAEAQSIVDASDEQLRHALLSGQLNRVSCAACGATTRLRIPLLYHDAAAEVALVLVPQSLELSREAEERTIGQLTNRVLSALPPAERKSYLLQPRTFISEESFLAAVLEASGVTPEALAQARQAARLVDALLAAEDEEAQDRILAQSQGVDYHLLAVVTALAEDAARRGDQTRAQKLLALRNRLASKVGLAFTADDLVAELVSAHDQGRLEEAVTAWRQLLDYQFFSHLTRRIESAAGEEKQRLTALRATLLEAIDRVDEAVRAEVEAAVGLLRAVLQAPDPEAAVRVLAEAPGGAFFLVLEANIAAARGNGQQEQLELLERVRAAAVERVEAAMSPKERLVSRLARTSDPKEQVELLDSSGELVDAQLAEMIDEATAAARAAGATEVLRALEAAGRLVATRLAQSKAES